MLVTVVIVGLVMAVVARRIPWVSHRLSAASSTLLTWAVAILTAVFLEAWSAGALRAVAAAGIAIAGALVAVVVGAWVSEHVAHPLMARARRRREGPGFKEHLLAFADRHPLRIAGVNAFAVVLRSSFRIGEVRVTGLAAEMSYYGLISLVSLATALGASLGYLRPVLGDEVVDQIRESVVQALTTVFAEQVAVDVLAPLVDGLLEEQRTSFAIGSLLVTLYLASRVFRAAVRALDDAYRVSDRRGIVSQYALGLVFSLGLIVTVVAVLLLVVIGPLLGGGSEIASWFGLGDGFKTAWQVLRWPVVIVILGAFLTLLYRYAPNVDNVWTQCLPGAVVGTLGVLLVSSGFTLYMRFAVPETMGTSADDSEVVQAAAQMLGLVLAGVLWLWLSSIAILVGGVVDAELDAQRSGLYTASAHEEPLPARTGELSLPAVRGSGASGAGVRRLWRPRAAVAGGTASGEAGSGGGASSAPGASAEAGSAGANDGAAVSASVEAGSAAESTPGAGAGPEAASGPGVGPEVASGADDGVDLTSGAESHPR